MPAGRPSSYNADTVSALCERIAAGESVKSICRDKAMPSEYTVYKWLNDFPEFAKQYAHARERQADFYADDIIRIADECEDPQKARVQIDARKWKASKMAPKKYGDRQEVELSGSVEVALTPEARAAEIARLMAKLKPDADA